MQASFQNSCSPLSQPRRSSLILSVQTELLSHLPLLAIKPPFLLLQTGFPSLLILCKAELQILAQMGKRVASISRNEQFVCRAVIKFALWWLNLPTNARIYISRPQPVVRWDGPGDLNISLTLVCQLFLCNSLQHLKWWDKYTSQSLIWLASCFPFIFSTEGSGEIKS